MDRDIPWFNKRFGGPNMGMRQVLAWAMSPFALTMVADGDVVPCPHGAVGLLRHLQRADDGRDYFDLVYGPPMFGMARSGNYRAGYRLLPEIRAAYDALRPSSSHFPGARDGGERARAARRGPAAHHHLSKPSQLAALSPTKPRKREVVVACAPYEPGAAGGGGGGGGGLHGEMPFECFREPNTGVMAFAMDRPNVRLLLLKAYDAYRRLIVAARRNPSFFVGGSGTQYAFREAIWAMVHGSSSSFSSSGQQTLPLLDGNDQAAQRPSGAPFKVAMLTTICRAMSCKALKCGDSCLIIHSRKYQDCGGIKMVKR